MKKSRKNHKEFRPCVFLDRDGTINVETGYLHSYHEWKWIPGAVQTLGKLRAAGYLIIIVTNQSGIARGYYSSEEVNRLHDSVNNYLIQVGCKIDSFYFCPHHPYFGEMRFCDCRKPAPGMLLRAQQEWNIDFSRSWMIGDKASDVEAGLAVGARSILVHTGYGSRESVNCPQSVNQVESIIQAGTLILENTSNRLPPAGIDESPFR